MRNFRGSHTSSKKQNSMKSEKSAREMRTQSRAVPCEGGVTTLFSICSNSQRNCYLQSSTSHTQASASQALPTKLQSSSRKCSQVLFLHLHMKRNDTLNSLGKQVVPTTNYEPGSAAWTILGNCTYAQEGVTTPFVSNEQIPIHEKCIGSRTLIMKFSVMGPIK